MIALRHRFHGHSGLRGVYQRGHSVRGPMMSLKFLHRDPRRPYRVAVVVSRKVSKSAVVRNRIRRRIYELVRRQDKGIPPGTDLVFTAFDERLAKLEPAKLQSIVNSLLDKVSR